MFPQFLEKVGERKENNMSTCSKIRYIVRLRQMLRRWRKKAAMANATRRLVPSDVPAGHVAVCVGVNRRRYVVRLTHLNHPVFKKLLVQAEEEFGFNQSGPLIIPCDETIFEEIILYLTRSDLNKSGRFANIETFQRYCHVGIRSNIELWPECRPLLNGLSDKSIW